MTKEQKTEINFLNKSIKSIRNSKIHYSTMTFLGRNFDEGYNDGIEASAVLLEKRVKILIKKYS